VAKEYGYAVTISGREKMWISFVLATIRSKWDMSCRKYKISYTNGGYLLNRIHKIWEHNTLFIVAFTRDYALNSETLFGVTLYLFICSLINISVNNSDCMMLNAGEKWIRRDKTRVEWHVNNMAFELSCLLSQPLMT
jgi:hypothetical protein